MFDNLLQGINLLLIAKVGILSLIGLFIIFLFIVSNQVGTLSKIIEQKETGFLKVFILILIVLSISLFLTALAIL